MRKPSSRNQPFTLHQKPLLSIVIAFFILPNLFADGHEAYAPLPADVVPLEWLEKKKKSQDSANILLKEIEKLTLTSNKLAKTAQKTNSGRKRTSDLMKPLTTLDITCSRYEELKRNFPKEYAEHLQDHLELTQLHLSVLEELGKSKSKKALHLNRAVESLRIQLKKQGNTRTRSYSNGYQTIHSMIDQQNSE